MSFSYSIRQFSLLLCAALLISGCRLDGIEEPAVFEAPGEPCNGSLEMCDRMYNDVTFATTNKSYNYEVGYTQFETPNQRLMIHQQLKDGVRALILDVYDSNGELVVYHNSDFLGVEPLSAGLGEIHDFMADNPRQVVTIIFQTDVAGDDLIASLVDAGLDDYAYVPANAGEWPTLGQMIETDGRLVLFTSGTTGSAEWLLPAWDHIFATADGLGSRTEFDCDPAQGAATNELFLLRHHVNGNVFGLPLPVAVEDSARNLNAYAVLYARAQDCWDFHGKRPNFLSVDFYDFGDLFQVVDSLNLQ